ncbi:MAG TPA: hypothetical protein VKE22_13390 [Haliangiales bacterium]|nr:hypothetical protein [Haliangiales bacterium]
MTAQDAQRSWHRFLDTSRALARAGELGVPVRVNGYRRRLPETP